MGFWRSAAGTVEVELTSADAPATMKAAIHKGIEVINLRQKTELTYAFRIRRTDLKALQEVAAQKSDNLRILGRFGIYWQAKSFLNRPVLIFGLILMLVLIVYLPTGVLFISVEGNVDLPTKLILEKAEKSGILFGASRREVRSEQMKNRLLQELPQLQWAGINTYGCRAVISVRERSETDIPEASTGVSRIVAIRDGVITHMTVIAGNALCKPGQAVTAGQTLVSGFTDCGITIRGTRAKGEIYAKTQHELQLITPANGVKRGGQMAVEKKYSLILGKYRINLYKDSGISGTTCVKMYEERYMTLPGGFQLPIILVTQTVIETQTETVKLIKSRASDFLAAAAQNCLRAQMVAGAILEKEQTLSYRGGVYILEGNYACLEMIGRERSEEIINGKND